MIWAIIKETWTIPVNPIKETVDLETMIAIMIERDGKNQKWWFGKKSGNGIYDQKVIRTITKSEPLALVPKGMSEDIHGIRIRFLQN